MKNITPVRDIGIAYKRMIVKSDAMRQQGIHTLDWDHNIKMGVLECRLGRYVGFVWIKIDTDDGL